MIRQATIEDLPVIARIHKENFGDHYLGQFSEKLIAAFYESFVGMESFIVQESNSCDIQGFILGGVSEDLSRRSNEFIRRNPWRYVFEIMWRPQTWIPSIGKLYNLIYAQLHKREKKQVADSPMFSLLSIAVAKSCQHQGVATNMQRYFETLCPFEYYRLSVHTNNKKARAFYEKMGMTQYPSNSKKSLNYRKTISHMSV